MAVVAHRRFGIRLRGVAAPLSRFTGPPNEQLSHVLEFGGSVCNLHGSVGAADKRAGFNQRSRRAVYSESDIVSIPQAPNGGGPSSNLRGHRRHSRRALGSDDRADGFVIRGYERRIGILGGPCCEKCCAVRAAGHGASLELRVGLTGRSIGYAHCPCDDARHRSAGRGRIPEPNATSCRIRCTIRCKDLAPDVTDYRIMSFEHAPKPSHIDMSFRPGGMIGMLDYRASKLYRLLVFPIKLASIAFEIIVIAICVLVAGQWSTTLANRAAELGMIHRANIYGGSIVFHIVSGVVLTIIVITILGILWTVIIIWVFNKVFLFFIDVIPSEGRSYPQALSVLQYGDRARLLLKMEHPETWTDSTQ